MFERLHEFLLRRVIMMEQRAASDHEHNQPKRQQELTCHHSSMITGESLKGKPPSDAAKRRFRGN